MNLKLFLKNLAHTLDAPDSVSSLRRAILDLAVRGKLVSQNSKDEPASKLLKQFKEEKTKLEKMGKVKPTTPLLPLADSEKPFSIPAGWKWVKSGNILNLQYGKSLTASQRVDNGKVPVYGSNGIVGYYHQYLTKPPAIIIGRKGSAGLINISLTPSWATDVAYYLIPPVCYNIHFLFYTLSTLNLETMGKGVKPGLNRNEFYQLPIPLPPLVEQKRIVAKVDSLISLCDQLEVVQQERDKARERFAASVLGKLTSPAQNFEKSVRFMLSHFADIITHPEHVKELRRVILGMAVRGKLVSQNPKDESASKLLKQIKEEKNKQEKAGKIKPTKPLPSLANSENPFSIPAGWEWVSLHHIGNIFNGNSINATVKQEKYSAVKNGIPFIATKDVKTGWQKLNYENGISIPKDEPGFRVAHKNAVLICSEGGSAGKKCGFAARDIYFGNKLIANELYGGIESDFVLSWYQTASFSELFTMQMKGIIGGISANNFKSLSIPIPPLAEQKRIVAKVNALMSLCDQLELALTDSRDNRRRLLNSLLNTAA